MRLNKSSIFWAFIWSIFMGITVISIGLGAAFPSMNRIAKLFICPRGEMELETQDYRPSPVETVTTLTWYCVDKAIGVRTELGIFPMSLYAGLIYGLLLFVVIFIIMRVRGNRLMTGWQSRASHIYHESEVKVREETLARMMELKKLRDADMISEDEYQKKRAEIIRDL